jgi:hypothetical protein
MESRAMKYAAALALALSLVGPGVACAQAANEPPQITGIAVRRSASRDFVPERSFIVNQGDKLYSYEIRLRFKKEAPLPVDFQTFSCEADRKTDKPFRFAYRNQSIPAGRLQSDTYHLIVPFDDVDAVVCMIGPWRPLKPGKAR